MCAKEFVELRVRTHVQWTYTEYFWCMMYWCIGNNHRLKFRTFADYNSNIFISNRAIASAVDFSDFFLCVCVFAVYDSMIADENWRMHDLVWM